MSVEKAKEFLGKLEEKGSDDALIAKIGAASSEEEKISIAADIARELGYDVTEADVEEAMTAMMQDNEDMIPLDDSDLEDVAGGAQIDKFKAWCKQCNGYVAADWTGSEEPDNFISFKYTKMEVVCPRCKSTFWLSYHKKKPYITKKDYNLLDPDTRRQLLEWEGE